jgi:hypothetical protein
MFPLKKYTPVLRFHGGHTIRNGCCLGVISDQRQDTCRKGGVNREPSPPTIFNPSTKAEMNLLNFLNRKGMDRFALSTLQDWGGGGGGEANKRQVEHIYN